MPRTSDAVEIMDQMMSGDQELRRLAAQAEIDAIVAQQVYEARTRAGLSQKQLAHLVGTRPSVIERLEDGDYQGRSLAMLGRIATALHQHLVIRMTPGPEPLAHAG